jgi:hypothetical protein
MAKELAAALLLGACVWSVPGYAEELNGTLRLGSPGDTVELSDRAPTDLVALFAPGYSISPRSSGSGGGFGGTGFSDNPATGLSGPHIPIVIGPGNTVLPLGVSLGGFTGTVGRVGSSPVLFSSGRR